jgi:hypothetical protein
LLRASALLLVLVLTACATEPVGRPDLLNFLNDGVTRREDVHLQLGEPSTMYEGSRILAYRLKKDGSGGYTLVGKRENWQGTLHSLILVFDEGGILKRHALVTVQSP